MARTTSKTRTRRRAELISSSRKVVAEELHSNLKARDARTCTPEYEYLGVAYNYGGSGRVTPSAATAHQYWLWLAMDVGRF